MDTARLIAAIPADVDGWFVALDEMMLSDDEVVATLADELESLLTAVWEDDRISPESARACGFEWADLVTLFEAGILSDIDDGERYKVRFAPLDDVRGAA